MKGYILSAVAVLVLGGGVVWALQAEKAASPVASAALRQDGSWRLPSQPAGIAELDGCAACHALRATDAERAAPGLAGVVGRPVAAVPWFGYSPALRRWGGTWTPERLAEYLRDPMSTVPGTSKTLSPIRDPERLEAIVRALSDLSAS